MSVDTVSIPASASELRQAELPVRRALRSLVERSSIDDVMQEMWLAALGQRESPRKPAAWLQRVALNLARRARRDRSRSAQAVPVESLAVAAAPAGDAQATLDLVLRCIAALDDPYRSALYLRLVAGEQPSAIAVKLGIPASTVRSHLLRGLDRLRGGLLAADPDLRELARAKRARRRRLAIAAVLPLALALGAGGAWLASSGGSQATPSPPFSRAATPELERAHTLAKLREMASGPFEKLLGGAGMFVVNVMHTMPDDPLVWRATGRLIHAVVENDPRVPAGLRTQLLDLGGQALVPAYMRSWFDLLKSGR